MSVGAINSLLSGYPVAPISRYGYSEPLSMPQEPAPAPRKSLFIYDTMAPAEPRFYPRPQQSSLSAAEQQALCHFIHSQIVYQHLHARV